MSSFRITLIMPSCSSTASRTFAWGTDAVLPQGLKQVRLGEALLRQRVGPYVPIVDEQGRDPPSSLATGRLRRVSQPITRCHAIRTPAATRPPATLVSGPTIAF